MGGFIVPTDATERHCVLAGAQPRTVRHVQQQMALVRMFSNFIRWMHRAA